MEAEEKRRADLDELDSHVGSERNGAHKTLALAVTIRLGLKRSVRLLKACTILVNLKHVYSKSPAPAPAAASLVISYIVNTYTDSGSAKVLHKSSPPEPHIGQCA